MNDTFYANSAIGNDEDAFISLLLRQYTFCALHHAKVFLLTLMGQIRLGWCVISQLAKDKFI